MKLNVALQILALFVVALIAGTLRVAKAQSDAPAPLRLEASIPLGDVRGRIDHMAIDLARQRLFIAELGNNSVSVVDLKAHKVVRRISGLSEPQGVGYVPATDTLYVANGGDGTLRLFKGDNYSEAGRLSLGADADNIRIDNIVDYVIVGYGSGALATIEAVSQSKIADLPLTGHPESFQLSHDETRIFVNIPDAHEIAIIDRSLRKQVARWPMSNASGNFPMALDDDGGRVFTVFRYPAKLGVFAMLDGKSLATADVCGDADDIHFDAKRQRLYVSCGDGTIDVLNTNDGFRRVASIPTVTGARTALFEPDFDRLFLAVRAQRGVPAALWIFQPQP
jgi:YVTN family beta-propeller protein